MTGVTSTAELPCSATPTAGVSLLMAAAWFKVHLMGDTATASFYGPGCTFCTDSRVKVEQKSLMAL